jgi:alpha-tubulin suppressor-like RCC1 family protein
VGFGHVCGLVASGQAYCWGQNDVGQLGDGTTTERTDPIAVRNSPPFVALAAGGGYVTVNAQPNTIGGVSCGLTASGQAYCWGLNVQGQLGIDSQSDFSLLAQPVAGGISFTGLRAGSTHVCGLAIGGAAYCWGGNQSGQFGDGTQTGARRPTPVFGQ